MKFTDWLWHDLGVTIFEFEEMTEDRQRKLLKDYLCSEQN